MANAISDKIINFKLESLKRINRRNMAKVYISSYIRWSTSLLYMDKRDR